MSPEWFLRLKIATLGAPFVFSACPPVPCKQPNGAAGAPYTVVQLFAESKRDDPTHRELESERGGEKPA